MATAWAGISQQFRMGSRKEPSPEGTDLTGAQTDSGRCLKTAGQLLGYVNSGSV